MGKWSLFFFVLLFLFRVGLSLMTGFEQLFYKEIHLFQTLLDFSKKKRIRWRASQDEIRSPWTLLIKSACCSLVFFRDRVCLHLCSKSLDPRSYSRSTKKSSFVTRLQSFSLLSKLDIILLIVKHTRTHTHRRTTWKSSPNLQLKEQIFSLYNCSFSLSLLLCVWSVLISWI